MTAGGCGESLERAIQSASQAWCFDDLFLDAIPHVARALDTTRYFIYRFDGIVRPIVGDLDLWAAYEAGAYPERDPHWALKRAKNPEVIISSRDLGIRTYQSSEVYQEFFRRNDIEHQLGWRLSAAGHFEQGMCGLLMMRSRRQSDYSEREVGMLRRVAGAMRAAAARCERSAVDRALPVIAAFLDAADPRPRLAMTFEGRPLWLSPRVEVMLAKHVGGKRELPRALIDAVASIGAIARGEPVQAGTALFGVSFTTDDGARLRAELGIGKTGSGRSYVIADLRDAAAAVIPAHLRELVARYQLTPVETDVLALLSLGLCNEEIARRRGLAVELVTTYRQRLLHKLGVASRTTQVGLIARGT
jgi:DNA-binding CsgD family transcriptional regulator